MGEDPINDFLAELVDYTGQGIEEIKPSLQEPLEKLVDVQTRLGNDHPFWYLNAKRKIIFGINKEFNKQIDALVDGAKTRPLSCDPLATRGNYEGTWGGWERAINLTQNPPEGLNGLFLYGVPGCGKTRLLSTINNEHNTLILGRRDQAKEENLRSVVGSSLDYLTWLTAEFEAVLELEQKMTAIRGKEIDPIFGHSLLPSDGPKVKLNHDVSDLAGVIRNKLSQQHHLSAFKFKLELGYQRLLTGYSCDGIDATLPPVETGFRPLAKISIKDGKLLANSSRDSRQWGIDASFYDQLVTVAKGLEEMNLLVSDYYDKIKSLSDSVLSRGNHRFGMRSYGFGQLLDFKYVRFHQEDDSFSSWDSIRRLGDRHSLNSGGLLLLDEVQHYGRVEGVEALPEVIESIYDVNQTLNASGRKLFVVMAGNFDPRELLDYTKLKDAGIPEPIALKAEKVLNRLIGSTVPYEVPAPSYRAQQGANLAAGVLGLLGGS